MPTQGAPTPWWQLPEYSGGYQNLVNSAPPGYQYDAVQMKYVPIVGSATDALAQRTRTQGIEDTLLGTTGAAVTGTGIPTTAPTTGSSSFPTVAPPTVAWPGAASFGATGATLAA